MLASCNDVAQESPHFENGLISALFGPHVERMGALRPRICRGATSLSTIARSELAVQDSSYESRRIKMPTSSCILALEKMRGWLRSTPIPHTVGFRMIASEIAPLLPALIFLATSKFSSGFFAATSRNTDSINAVTSDEVLHIPRNGISISLSSAIPFSAMRGRYPGPSSRKCLG